MYLDNERRPTLTPQLAVRVALFGGIALAAFAVIFFRLWFLQVLSSDAYVKEARGNQLREIRVQPPRGDIVDREGRVLVTNRVGLAVELTPEKLSDDRRERMALYRRLGRVLDMRPRAIQRRVRAQFKELPFSKATIKTDVPRDVVMYIEEREEKFSGVEVDPVFLREYPHKELGAHLFGYVEEFIAPKMVTALTKGSFLKGFNDKGRFSSFMQEIEAAISLNPRAALIGAAHYALRL